MYKCSYYLHKHIYTKTQKFSPIFNVAWIRKLLHNNSDIIKARLLSDQTVLYHILQVCKTINNILHVRQRSCSWPRRPISTRSQHTVGKCDNLRKHDHMYIWCFAGQDSELVTSRISTDKAT